jgi:hypothetical protein
MHFLINVTALLTETMGDGNKMLDLGEEKKHTLTFFVST